MHMDIDVKKTEVIEANNISRLMKYFRKAKGMSQEELSNAAGINLSTIKKYEVGLRNPKYEQLEKIASALDINVSNFYETEINTIGDLISIIKTLDEQLDIIISADKNDDGEYLPDTVSITFKSKKINKALLEYVNIKKNSNDKEKADNELIKLLSSDEKIRKATS